MPVYAVTPTLFVGDEVPDLSGVFIKLDDDPLSPGGLDKAVSSLNSGMSVVVATSAVAHSVLTELTGSPELSEAAIRLSNLWEEPHGQPT